MKCIQCAWIIENSFEEIVLPKGVGFEWRRGISEGGGSSIRCTGEPHPTAYAAELRATVGTRHKELL
ncbi:hypothetical protein TNCV_3199291 [Trichonephila clavipes]|nr:hypothetical protein TNCV_3199291 [Trichonephila clavipes]